MRQARRSVWVIRDRNGNFLDWRDMKQLALRRVFGLESVKDAEGNVIKEAPLPIWANFQQRALDVALAEVNAKTDLKIKLASTERSKHRRVVSLNFTIKTQPIRKGQRD